LRDRRKFARTLSTDDPSRICKKPRYSVSAFHFRNKESAHEHKPGHPFIRHALGQEVRDEDVQQKLQKRVKHVEHDEEVKQRDGDIEDMFESDGRYANEHASEWIRDE